MSVYVGLLASLILSVLSSWFYDIATASGWLPSNPSRKRVLVIVAACIPLTALVVLPEISESANNSKTQPYVSTFTTQDDDGCKFSLEYPEGWIAQSINNPITKEITAFLPSNSLSVEKPKIDIIVSCIPLNELLSLTEYVDMIVVEKYNVAPNIKKATVREIILTNGKAREINYERRQDNQKWQYMDVVTLKSGYAYHIKYRAPSSKYSRYERDVRQMLKSLKVQ